MIIFVGLDSEVKPNNVLDFFFFREKKTHVAFTPVFFPLLQFVYQEALVTTICDMYPEIFQNSCRRKLLLLAISVGSFLVGLLMVTEVRGQWLISSIEHPSRFGASRTASIGTFFFPSLSTCRAASTSSSCLITTPALGWLCCFSLFFSRCASDGSMVRRNPHKWMFWPAI